MSYLDAAKQATQSLANPAPTTITPQNALSVAMNQTNQMNQNAAATTNQQNVAAAAQRNAQAQSEFDASVA
jgi:hypothetical protein